MNTFWLILVCGYVVPMLILFTYSLFDHENPFDKDNRGRIFIPFKNLFNALVFIFLYTTVTLIEFGEFCEDVKKAFKERFC